MRKNEKTDLQIDIDQIGVNHAIGQPRDLTNIYWPEKYKVTATVLQSWTCCLNMMPLGLEI